MARMVPYRRALPLVCAVAVSLSDSTALARMEILTVTEGYILPLANRYAIHRPDGFVSDTASGGVYELVELSSDPQGPAYSHCTWTTVLPGVEQIAVVGTAIAGETRDGYFLLETDRADAKPQIFDSLEKLESAMAAAGISGPLRLTSPDTIAATKPPTVLRPWHYRVMDNAWGRSDGEWSLIVQIAGLAVVLAVALLSRSRRPLVPAALAAGIIVNLVAQMFLGGGGGAVAGFIIYPVIYYVAALAAHTARRPACCLCEARPAAASRPPEDRSSHP